ncbi:MAG: methionine--tRNA ligase subunit beta, partial [Pyrinomonadaceae bacterium]|nr:methionine--tRNA ligase subunit beta [Pyrinomonadaceae bacterium]
GRTPKEQVDLIAGELKRMFHDFRLDGENGGYDIFMRTTEQFHYEGVQHLWREIAKNKTPKGNDTIYKGFYEGWFCGPCAEFKGEADRTLEKSDTLKPVAGEFISELNLAVERGLVKPAEASLFADWLESSVSEGIDGSIGMFESDAFESGRHQEVSIWDAVGNYIIKLSAESSDEVKSLSDSYYRMMLVVDQNHLITPRCLIHSTPLDLVLEDSYYFRLSDYDDFLIEVIENSPGLLRPEGRKNEVISFVRSGLQDLSISRMKDSVSWGVPVPDDDEHVMYVWLDALSNYITAIGYGNSAKASVGFEKYWQNVTHLVGKDILRFHTVYWFSFLAAAGLPLPKTVYAHGMWLDADGRKMGKTIGNVIEVDVLHEHFQVDALRYFVLREMVFGQDGKFGYENLIERANADLASGLGNLASRTFSMITKYREGLVPNGKIAEENYLQARRAGIDPDGQDLVSVIEHARDEFLRRFDNFEFSQGLETIWTVIARVDKLISDSKPWELIKDDKQSETLNAVLYRASETLRWLCVLLYPVMPESAKNIYRQIGLSDDIATLDPANLKWGELAAGTKIGETIGVFPRIDKNKVMNEIAEKSEARSQESEPEAVATGSPVAVEQVEAEVDNFITIDDFLKVELKVGEIKVAERIANADKLLRFEIDLGEPEYRQILAGLAEYYEPETLIGRKVVVVANLKPRKMRGLESQGMICAASLEDGTGEKPALAAFIENVDIGARLK